MEQEHLIEQLQLSFYGKPEWKGHAWHGPSVMSTLKEVTLSQIHNRLTGSHSIMELVLHMTIWRNFVCKKLQGDEDFDVSKSDNFKNGDDWALALAQLEQSQIELIAEIKKMDTSALEQAVPGRLKYNFRTMLQGIIHHDLYHTGQIALLKKIKG